MSGEQNETTRWGLILIGLAVTAGVVWWDQSQTGEDDASIVQPATRASSKAVPGEPKRDFVAGLTDQGIASTLNPVASIPKSALNETLQRPVFARTRRQPEPPPPVYTPPPAPPPPPNPRELKLVGVMIGGDGAVALVRTRNARTTISVRQGEIIDGWTIESINSREMKVQKENVRATIIVSAGDRFQPNFRQPPRQEPMTEDERVLLESGNQGLPPNEDSSQENLMQQRER